MKQAVYWAAGAVVAFLLLKSTSAKAASNTKSSAKNLIKSDAQVNDVLNGSSTPKEATNANASVTTPTNEEQRPKNLELMTPRTLGGRLEYGTVDSEGKWTSSLTRPEPQAPSASMPPERRRRRRSANFSGGNGNASGRQSLVILDNTPFPIRSYAEDFDVDNFDEGGGL